MSASCWVPTGSLILCQTLQNRLDIITSYTSLLNHAKQRVLYSLTPLSLNSEYAWMDWTINNLTFSSRKNFADFTEQFLNAKLLGIFSQEKKSLLHDTNI